MARKRCGSEFASQLIFTMTNTYTSTESIAYIQNLQKKEQNQLNQQTDAIFFFPIPIFFC